MLIDAGCDTAVAVENPAMASHYMRTSRYSSHVVTAWSTGCADYYKRTALGVALRFNSLDIAENILEARKDHPNPQEFLGRVHAIWQHINVRKPDRNTEYCRRRRNEREAEYQSWKGRQQYQQEHDAWLGYVSPEQDDYAEDWYQEYETRQWRRLWEPKKMSKTVSRGRKAATTTSAVPRSKPGFKAASRD